MISIFSRRTILKIKSNTDEIFASKNIAVAGVSEDINKFGGKVFRDLKKRGYTVFPVNPNLDVFDGQRCYQSVKDLPADVKALVCVTPPGITEKIVKDAAEKGIKHVWFQPGAESKKAIDFSIEKGISVISNTCIMMTS